ncbi:acyl-CoA dehydrogenase [Compostibacillus humi]|uniref:Acyl-CoA dehydrogenase n=1 Tax=Compostibacillus humi TaxID=1245525 RepID=A0A8J2ZQV0_9BACI|nr:acyl-CoA dehydrogenase family protein [Compostibacillus humi]GGH70828.1 acyl-CoA dehydrogenase [Compostibacillus humi]
MANFYTEDIRLQQILRAKLPANFFQWADNELHQFGELAAGTMDERARHTDREGQPRLIRYDKMGNEVSRIWVNEGYRKNVNDAYNTGIVGYIHKEIPELGRKGNYIYSFAQGYLLSQTEPGLYCPVTLTKATAYLLDHYASPKLKEKYLPHVLSTGETELYEGATFLTERQGGSDVGANEVKAVEEGDHYRIYGEKYFASNAGMCGVAMILARREGAPTGTKGLSLFAVPWEENRKNGFLRIRRLKDKLGVRAVPSAEVEFDSALGYLVGGADKGFYYMMEALNLSRVSNAIASLGIMRRAYTEAVAYTRERKAFGKRLIEYPMVQETLGKLVSKLEIEMEVMFDVIELMDRVMGPPGQSAVPSAEEQILFRLFVALMKVETAEQAIHFSHEAIELHGGNGYIEDFVTPRLLRDAQVLTVWEGTANILGLEVLRLMRKYDAEKLFASKMEERLQQLKGGLPWKAIVAEALQNLLQETEKVKQMPEELQTFYCKKIGKKMTGILESVTALEQLANGNSRDRAIAEVFLQNVWKKNELEMEPAVLKHFDEIVRGVPAGVSYM